SRDAHRGTDPSHQALPRRVGVAVRAERLLLYGRLFPRPGIPQVVPDPHVHDRESWIDRRRFHAHGVGTAGPHLRHPGPPSGRAGVRRHNGFGIRLHASHAADILRAGTLGLTDAAHDE